MMSQRDCAPLRAGPYRQSTAQYRLGLGEIIDDQIESAEMASGGRDPSLHHGKVGKPGRGDHGGRHDQHGDVEMLLEQFSGFDRDFVPAVDKDGAGTFDVL